MVTISSDEYLSQITSIDCPSESISIPFRTVFSPIVSFPLILISSLSIFCFIHFLMIKAGFSTGDSFVAAILNCMTWAIFDR